MIRRALAALAAPLALAACGEPPATGAVPIALLELAPADARVALGAAHRHVLVVRHAQRDPDCGDVSCPLTEEGQAAVARLGALLETAGVDAAFASAACRTAATAYAGGVRPVVYRVIDTLTEGCATLDLDPGGYTRGQAQADVAASPARWTLVSDHSNFVCSWPAAFGAERLSVCLTGELSETDYGDIFWLYQPAEGAGWGIVQLVDAFTGDVTPAED